MEQYKNKGMQRARGETTIELLREEGGSDQRSLMCTNDEYRINRAG